MKKTILSLALALAVPFASAEAQKPVATDCKSILPFDFGANVEYLYCVGGLPGNDNNTETFSSVNKYFNDYIATVDGTATKSYLLGEGYGTTMAVDTKQLVDPVLVNPIPVNFGDGNLFAVSFKQSTFYSIYYFVATGNVSAINWSTDGVSSNGGTTPKVEGEEEGGDVSHINVWGTQGGGINECPDGSPLPCEQVPEPSSYALMMAGLAALGVVARRRRNNA